MPPDKDKVGGQMLSIAVCDDNIRECCGMAERIRKILERRNVSCLIRQFGSGRELLHAVEDFDIIFLDIIMCELDGMETAQMFRQRSYDKLLVFMSSSRAYVFDAYDVEAFGYLVKPVRDDKLEKVLGRALAKIESKREDFILVSRDRQKRKWFLDDIYYFEIRGREMEVHGREDSFTYYEQMGTLEKQLVDKGFFRCHKSYLINLKHVDGYNRQEVVMDNGARIWIAKRRYEEFCAEILRFMRSRGV